MLSHTCLQQANCLFLSGQACQQTTIMLCQACLLKSNFIIFQKQIYCWPGKVRLIYKKWIWWCFYHVFVTSELLRYHACIYAVPVWKWHYHALYICWQGLYRNENVNKFSLAIDQLSSSNFNNMMPKDL